MVERRRPQVGTCSRTSSGAPGAAEPRPTLHRLGIQAFEPILVEGKAIQVHPLVLGVQRRLRRRPDGGPPAAVAEAQAEARVLMLSANNMLSPAARPPLVTPTQDMVIGSVLPDVADRRGRGPKGRAYEAHGPGRRTSRRHGQDPACTPPSSTGAVSSPTCPSRRPRSAVGGVATTAGRPCSTGRARGLRSSDFRPSEEEGHGAATSSIVAEGERAVAQVLDAMQGACFRYAMRSGLTISIERRADAGGEGRDPRPPRGSEADQVEKQFRACIITDGERHEEGGRDLDRPRTSEVTRAMQKAMQAAVQPDRHDGRLGRPREHDAGPSDRRHARPGGQPPGDMIPRPIKSNFREGLSVLEYFIATPAPARVWSTRRCGPPDSAT